MSNENINHPSYYNKGGYECIDVMRAVFGEQAVNDFCLCNAFKYVFRAKSKHKSPIDDLKKARYYLDYIIRSEEKETSSDDMKVKCEEVRTYGWDNSNIKADKFGSTIVYCGDNYDIKFDNREPSITITSNNNEAAKSLQRYIEVLGGERRCEPKAGNAIIFFKDDIEFNDGKDEEAEQ